MGEFAIPQNWPLWAILLVLGVKAFKKELAILIPTGIREHFAHKAKMRADAQEHEQELEEVSVEALAQSAVTAQMQLINVNRHLIEFITRQIDSRLSEIEQAIHELKLAAQKQDARGVMVQIEWSRVVETLTRTEKLLESIEAWFRGFHATQSGEAVQSSGLPESEL